jgi:Domain of unknown function (DUF4868)
MNLFALTHEPLRRVLRIPMSHDVQGEVEALFKQQQGNFNETVEEEILFDGNYKPDDDECLCISNYDDLDNLHNAIANPLAIQEVAPHDFPNVRALFAGMALPQGEKVALIQSFDRRRIISPSGISIFHSGNVYRKVDGVGLTLDNRLAAILENDTLKFFSFHVVRRIFDLTQYYVEATNSDLQNFVKSGAVYIENEELFLAVADGWIRRKVSLISQSATLDNVEIGTIGEVANKFGLTVVTKEVDGNVVIVLPENKAELKKLLRFLDEDYYQSSLQSKYFIPNSKRPVEVR